MPYSDTNGTLSWGNLINTATVTGGSYRAGFPLSNIKTRRLAEKAISTNTAPASSTMIIDLGRIYPISQIAVIDTNADDSCEYEITTATDSAFTEIGVYTGIQPFFPSVYLPEELEFEDDNWFTCTYSSEELAREQRNLYVEFTPTYARYVKIQIRNDTNVNGFVSIGRVFIPRYVWQFEINYDYGSLLTLESNTVVDKSLGGVNFFEERPQTKVFSFELSWLDKREAHSRAYEIMRSEDVSGEVLILPDKTDSINLFRSAVYGRMRQLNPVNAYQFGFYKTAFQIEGIL